MIFLHLLHLGAPWHPSVQTGFWYVQILSILKVEKELLRHHYMRLSSDLIWFTSPAFERWIQSNMQLTRASLYQPHFSSECWMFLSSNIPYPFYIEYFLAFWSTACVLQFSQFIQRFISLSLTLSFYFFLGLRYGNSNWPWKSFSDLFIFHSNNLSCLLHLTNNHMELCYKTAYPLMYFSIRNDILPFDVGYTPPNLLGGSS